MSMPRTLLLLLSAVLLLFTASIAAGGDEPSTGTFGVYEAVIDAAQGDLDSIAQAISASASENGWTSLAIFDVTPPSDCSFAAKVVVLYEKAWADALYGADAGTAAYAVVDRVAVYRDERGTHVAIVDPRSISRTVLMDDASFAPTAQDHRDALRALIAATVQGEPSEHVYGQLRTKGYIGKTMGVVAGGKFADLVKEKAKLKGHDPAAVADAVAAALAAPSKKWGLHSIYRLDLPEFDTVILGVSGGTMEAKSFEIVGAGADEARADDACPGLADAGAYPFELVIHRDGDTVKVSMVEAMFRMKMYFDDAGKWAFMNNMKMPGSIDKELNKQIKSGLKSLKD